MTSVSAHLRFEALVLELQLALCVSAPLDRLQGVHLGNPERLPQVQVLFDQPVLLRS
jgi:hypothetical protein